MKIICYASSFCFALFSGFFFVAAMAEEPASAYTLSDCIRIGFQNSPSLLNAARDRKIALSRITQAKAEALPQLSANAVYRRLDELQEIDFGEEAIELGVLNNYSVSAEISQLIYSGGRVRAALRAAELTDKYAEFAFVDAESKLILDIKTGFYEIILAENAIEVLEESVSQLESFLKQTKDKFDNGAASEYELISAKVKLANEMPNLTAARNIYRIALERFARLIGMDDCNFKLEGDLEFDAKEGAVLEFERLALKQRPAVKVMETLVGLKKEDIASAQSLSKPNLSTFFSYNGANAYQFVSYEDEWEWHWNAGFVLQWNIWDGMLARGRAKEKKLEWEKSRTEFDEFKKQVKLEVKTAYLDMVHASETVDVGLGNIELAEKALTIAKARHKTGVSTYLEFTDANLALSTARLTYLQALAGHMKAVARLEYAVGLSEKAKE
ncbi:TolC family protein [Verrucomicrobiota bacterium]